MDKICIDDLKIFARHGVFEHENINGQNFYVSAVMYVDTERAGIHDSLEDSVDYGSVSLLIRKVMTGNTYKLIETAAQAVATAVLSNFSLVEKIEVEIRKPEAPVPMEFRSVSVRIERSWHTAVIAFGSNIGDSRGYITGAINALENSPYIKNLLPSQLMVTKPYGYTDQSDFLNGAAICKTILSPHGLLDLLHDIENEAGRKREIHWGPRTLDLDIIFYDDITMNDPDLIIPHADMHNRSFVLAPIAQIAPDYRHPVFGKTVRELLREVKAK